MEDGENRAQGTGYPNQLLKLGWLRVINYVKREMHERRAHKQKESPTDRAARKTADATVWMAIFTVILAGVGIETLLVLQVQTRQDVRPWVAFDSTHEGGISIDPDDLFTTWKSGTEATIGVIYWLSNTGHSPAIVAVAGKVVEKGEISDFRDASESFCASARKKFGGNPRPWVVIPGNPVLYGLHYNGEPSDNEWERGEVIRINPPHRGTAASSYEFINVGCIVYSPADDMADIHQTPFVTHIHVRLSAASPYKVSDTLIIGRAD